MAKRTASRRGEVAEGLGALLVIVIGLVGVPLILALVVGWPLPQHLPTTTQLHGAAGSQIPEDFWPKALAVIAWIAWGYFVFSLALGTIEAIAFHRRGIWRRAAGKRAMAGLVTAVIVLATIRGSMAPHRIMPNPPVVALADVSHAADTITSPSSPTTRTYTVVAGDSLYDIARAHYGDGEDWHAIYAANVGVRQPDGRALDASNWVYPGWKLVLPNVPVPTAQASAVVEVPTEVAAPVAPPTVTPAVVTHIVTPGENLWDIAVTYYDDGEQWHAIYAANVSVAQPDGLALSDPSLIYPGWKLIIPDASAIPTASTPPQQPATPPSPPTATVPPTTSPVPTPSPSPSPHRITEHRSATNSHHSARTNTSHTPADTGATARVHTAVPSHASPHRGEHGNRELPAAVIGGLGLVGSAVIARSLRRRRRIARIGLRPGDMIAASSAPIRDLESALAALIDNPAVDWLDLAMGHLSQIDDDRRGQVPPIRLVRVGPGGVDLLLAEATGVAPGAFVATEEGWVWTLPAATDTDDVAGAGASPPWFSILVPVGEDEEGRTYLAPIEPATVLSVTGPGASEVVAAMATTTANWSASSYVTVTTDPAEAAAATHVDSIDRSGPHAGVLYLGSPLDLAPEVCSLLGILTTKDVAGTDLSLQCFADGAIEIMPMQLRLRATRLTPEAQSAITDAAATAETPPSPKVPEHQMVVGGAVDRVRRAPLVEGAPSVATDHLELELRVLTNGPAINGATQDRISGDGRHFELLALLALSGGLSKEEARAAMYASGSSAGHIANLASQSRKLLGVDADGQPLLPEASSRGVLALSPKVGSDLGRLCAIVSTAGTAETTEAIGLYAAALGLIEVTPGSTIDHSWNWWIHYAAIAERAALEAASHLARLTISTGGDLEVARHGINQARALAPYAEELYRSAIELAGAAGNLSWAQREWDELRRMLSDLSPGAAPSLETEAAFHAAMQTQESRAEHTSLPMASGFR